MTPSARYIARGMFLRRVGEVASGEADHGEAEVGEEGECHARDDGPGRRVTARREQVGVEVGESDQHKDREDGEQGDDDDRLCAVDRARSDDAQERRDQHQGGGEELGPQGRVVVPDDDGAAVLPERDGDHGPHDHDRGEVAEPGSDAHEPSVAEALDQVGDQPTRGRVVGPHFRHCVPERERHQPGRQERDPDGRSRDRARLAEQGEDPGTDHRADAQEDRTAQRDLLRRAEPGSDDAG